jgi:hypothetical protein
MQYEQKLLQPYVTLMKAENLLPRPSRQTLRDHTLPVRHLDHGPLLIEHAEQKLRQPVQVVGAENQVDKRIASLERIRDARFLHHTAAHANQKLRFFLFELLEPDYVASARFSAFSRTQQVL